MVNDTTTQTIYRERINALRQKMGDAKPADFVDILVITNLLNIRYLTGFTGSTAIVLVSQAEASIITDGRYLGQVANESPGFAVIEAKGSGGYPEALAATLKDRSDSSRIGFEPGHLTVARLDKWKELIGAQQSWVSTPNWIEELRFVKTAAEVESIRRAIKIAEKAFQSVLTNIQPGVTERDLAIELEFTMRRLGADDVAFSAIVASGPNGAYPHHTPKARAFEAGELVTIDWGARVDGYCSDITRTVVVPGKEIAPKLKEIYNIVYDAKCASTNACLAGANGKDVDAVARQIIIDAGYGDFFNHSLGHSLGMDVHDGNTVSQRSAEVTLVPGVVTTIEPGIYVPGIGGVRIEEDVLITESGPDILSSPAERLP